MAGFLGMVKVSDWPDGARPKSWREMILWLYPNGRAALTALLALAKKEKVVDYEYSWFTQTFPEQRGTFTAGEMYIEPILSTAVSGGESSGETVYVKTTEAVASEFRFGHQVLLRNASDLTADCIGKCIAVVKNGASSYVAVRLLEDDDNGTTGTLLTADTIKVIGNINPQGGVTPSAISYQPTKYYNKTQIYRTPLEIARTLMRIKSRTGNTYKNLKKLALELHSVEMEWGFISGILSENTGDNGQPETTSEGLLTFLRNNLSTHVRDYKTLSDYSAATWLEGGDDFMLDSTELLTRFTDQSGPNNYVGLAGSGFLKQLERLAKQNGQIMLKPASTLGFGIKIRDWVTSFATIPIITHPLFSQETTMRNTMLILKPSNIVYNYIDDTKFYGQSGKPYGYTSSGKRIDGLNEEFLTECGLEYHHPQTAMFLYGAGETNTA